MSAPCEWTVIRVYPDPLAGECVNIGVAVIASGMVYKRFLREWDRVTAFTGRPDWISVYAMVCDWDPEGLRWEAENSNGCVQYDALQPSMESDPQVLLTRLARLYLKDSQHTSPAGAQQGAET